MLKILMRRTPLVMMVLVMIPEVLVVDFPLVVVGDGCPFGWLVYVFPPPPQFTGLQDGYFFLYGAATFGLLHNLPTILVPSMSCLPTWGSKKRSNDVPKNGLFAQKIITS